MRNSITTTVTNIKQHSIGQSVFLHLLPGLIVSTLYFVLLSAAERKGIPAILLLLVAALLIIVPFELGYIFYQAKQTTGTFSLKNIVLYREKMKIWEYSLIAILLLIWGGLVMVFISPAVDNFFIKRFFSWIPERFFLTNFVNQLDSYSKPVLILTAGIIFVFNGFLGPIVEELYFRGYLLPRISFLGKWAPLFNVVLFSLYHFFTPWQNVTRILVFSPVYYMVWWKKNIYIGIIVHCLANSLGMIGLIAAILGAL